MNRVIWIAIVILLVLGGIWYFAGTDEEPRQAQLTPPTAGNEAQRQPQTAQPEQPATGMGEQQQPAEQGTSGGGMETAQSGDLTGKSVFSQDGQVLGVVSDVHTGSQGNVNYVIVKGDQDRLHPIPANLLKTQGDRVEASFDQNTFKNAPSFSAAEQQQISESQLDQVRGYYEGQGTAGGAEKGGQPQAPGAGPEQPPQPQ